MRQGSVLEGFPHRPALQKDNFIRAREISRQGQCDGSYSHIFFFFLFIFFKERVRKEHLFRV